MALFFILSIIYANGFKRSRSILIVFLLVFGGIGSIYFIWRWSYFGYPLPNPYYVKGGGIWHQEGFINSVLNCVSLGGPFWIIVIAALVDPSFRRKAMSFAIPIVLFIVLWGLLSSRMNFAGRFQLPILPITLTMVAYYLSYFLKTHSKFLKRIVSVYAGLPIKILIICLTCMILFYQHKVNAIFSRHNKDGRYDVAVTLSKYKDKGYCIATSEAGLLPLYSEWKTIDAYGLNDQYIAHNGGIDNFYLNKNKPEIIMFHAYFSPLTKSAQGLTQHKYDKITLMVETLNEYAIQNGYCLIADFGVSPYDTHYYYIKPDFPDKDNIINDIRKIQYSYFTTGQIAVDYGQFSPLYCRRK